MLAFDVWANSEYDETLHFSYFCMYVMSCVNGGILVDSDASSRYTRIRGLLPDVLDVHAGDAFDASSVVWSGSLLFLTTSLSFVLLRLTSRMSLRVLRIKKAFRRQVHPSDSPRALV